MMRKTRGRFERRGYRTVIGTGIAGEDYKSYSGGKRREEKEVRGRQMLD